MEMIGYLGKKVDINCIDGKSYSGYITEVYDQEDSSIGCDSVEISPIDKVYAIEIPAAEIIDVKIDQRYKVFDFRR